MSLSDILLSPILTKLALDAAPPPTLAGLASVYAAWTQAVPFDNTRKLLHIVSGDASPLPGDTPDEFFEAWLRWGTGGTCWAANGALCSLLCALGFDAARGVATMMAAPNLPPNHGTVVVKVEGRRWLLDATLLHEEPLPLEDDRDTAIHHPSRGVRCERREGKWYVRWRPLNLPDGLDCRIDKLSATRAEFSERHEATRGWSPFNYEVNVRRNVGGRVVGLASGHHVEIDAAGVFTRTPIDDKGRRRVLVEQLGIHPEIVARLPADRPTPPPPTSRTAAA